MAIAVSSEDKCEQQDKCVQKLNLTPHISCGPEDFAETVLMPGDPLRSKFIAETFLEDAKLVNNVRGVQGYTGYYNGTRVSVMASGMGMPSIGIYSYELYSKFNVQNIIRVGSAGALVPTLEVFDLVIAQAVCVDSNFTRQYELPGSFSPIADFDLLCDAVDSCKTEGVTNYKVGNILSSDIFYDDSDSNLKWTKMGVLAVEMEAAALYCNAARLGKRALAICTISDEVISGKVITPEERQIAFGKMIKVALNVAVAQSKKSTQV